MRRLRPSSTSTTRRLSGSETIVASSWPRRWCRDGNSSCRSVNVQPQTRQRKRRLRQTRKVRLPAIGRSRTRTSGPSFTSQLPRPAARAATAGRDELDLEVELVTPLLDRRHREPLEPEEPATLLLHPLFLPAPRSMTTQKLARTADVLPTSSTPA